jgi:hypothetical protein
MRGPLVRKLGIDALDLRVDVPGNPEDVGIAVVVEVDDAGSPTDVLAFAGDTGSHSLIFKFALAEIAEEASGLELEMSLDQVEMAVEERSRQRRFPCRIDPGRRG